MTRARKSQAHIARVQRKSAKRAAKRREDRRGKRTLSAELRSANRVPYLQLWQLASGGGIPGADLVRHERRRQKVA